LLAVARRACRADDRRAQWARIDRLDPGTREVISHAAVIGRSFELPLLEEVLEHGQVHTALSVLQRLDLVVEQRRRPVAEYRFRHGLVHEVAYMSLLDSRRRRRLELLGEALARRAGETRLTAAAHHFMSGRAREGGRAPLKAGDAARALYANQEALEHYRQARSFLARLGDEERTRETLFRSARITRVRPEQAEAEYDELLRRPRPARAEPTETL
jgi:predicted ATPase